MGGNRFAWLGNGVTVAQEKGLKTTWYLDEPMVTVENPFKTNRGVPKAVVEDQAGIEVETSKPDAAHDGINKIPVQEDKVNDKRKLDESGTERGLKSKKRSGSTKRS